MEQPQQQQLDYSNKTFILLVVWCSFWSTIQAIVYYARRIQWRRLEIGGSLRK